MLKKKRRLCHRQLLVDEVIDGCDLILAEIAAAKITLHLFEIVDDVGDVLLLQVLFWVFGEYLRVEVVEHFFRFYFWLGTLRSHRRLA